MTVRSSRHGPLISDVFKPAADALPQDFALAFAWTALRDDDRVDAGGRQACDRPQLERIPGGGARFRFAAAEHGVCGHRRQHRLRRARPSADTQARERSQGPGARAGLGCEIRLGRLHSVRRPAAQLQSRRRQHRHGQQEDRARRLSVLPHQRMGSALSRQAHPAAARCDAQAYAAELRADSGRYGVAAGARNPAAAAQDQDRRSRSATGTCASWAGGTRTCRSRARSR